MNKHTPAPWKSTFRINNERGVRSSGGFICFLPKPNRYSGQDERYEKELKESEANARLIAAAPELLEALEIIMKSEPLPKHLSDQAEHAIKKAKYKICQ